MAEHMRTEKYQFCDSELCMVVDRVTGEPNRVQGNAVCTVKKGLLFLRDAHPQWHDRYVLVKLQCIQGFKLTGDKTE